mmetsp:Transcript_22494/g.48763  ORF Transcript_22494/g.48763 Transcript_22494/m.48763 type:complete len:90 (-) Transcript_22494:448-717(-)
MLSDLLYQIQWQTVSTWQSNFITPAYFQGRLALTTTSIQILEVSLPKPSHAPTGPETETFPVSAGWKELCAFGIVVRALRAIQTQMERQ